MAQAKKAGAEVWFGSKVSEIGENYVTAGGRKIGFKNLVGADGSYSVVCRSLNLPMKLGIGIQYKIKDKFDCPELYFDAENFEPWYSWIAPHKNFTFVGAGADCEFLTTPEIKSRLEKWLSKRGINFCSSELEGAPIQVDYHGYWFGNKYLVGDAAGFASGWWGEGIYFAMMSGEDVAKIIMDKSHNPALIKKVLSIKRRHELIMNILRSNPHVNKMGFGLGFCLLNYNFFREWLIELVC